MSTKVHTSSVITSFKEALETMIFSLLPLRRSKQKKIELDYNLCNIFLMIQCEDEEEIHDDVIEDALNYVLDCYRFCGVSVDEIDLDLVLKLFHYRV